VIGGTLLARPSSTSLWRWGAHELRPAVLIRTDPVMPEV
jgi:hypothetical protein